MMLNSSNNNLDLSQQATLMSDQAELMKVLSSDQFPDILQTYSTEKCLLLLNLLVDCPSNIINKKGPLGGYSALHWMAIKNEVDLIEFLITKCKAEIDCVANLGETPLLICIK